ncbi:hypothetical protein BJ322DRAFT_537273 [Thelephora terrestris]|uniref:Uncharacterized protein n=1 Tax=Thelephora terrestris TaxID=56493 RepID=A0A9P6LA65_9AGAM|nr:hypothetical protein BJ322DRAFT_537273 [Thelephora terrestris]
MSTMSTPVKEVIRPGDDRILAVPLVCHFLSSSSQYLSLDMYGGSAVNLIDGYGRGGRSQNPSRTDLLRNASQDHLGQHGSDSRNLGKSTSHPDPVNPGGGRLPRQLSRRESSGVNGNPTGNAPNHDLASRTKPPDRSQPEASGAAAVPQAPPIVFEQPDGPIKKKGFCCF